MANSKSYIREINLQNSTINLNTNKSIISDFAGFNRNTGVWYNGVLSSPYCKEEINNKAGDIITIGNDTYKIVNDALYKNDKLVKDYRYVTKVGTEILEDVGDNVLAYTPKVQIYREGSKACVKVNAGAYMGTIIPVGEYSASTIPRIVIDDESGSWCIIYGTWVVCYTIGTPTTRSLTWSPEAVLFSNDKWYMVDVSNNALINIENLGDTIRFDMTSMPIIKGAANVTGWTPAYRPVQVGSRYVFMSITDLRPSISPSVTLNTNNNSKVFQYLKGFEIEGYSSIDAEARPVYSREGKAVNLSIVPTKYNTYVQPLRGITKLAQIRTKFLSYNSYLAIPYSTMAGTATNKYLSNCSVDGPVTYMFESLYTAWGEDFMTLSGSTAGLPQSRNDNVSETPKYIGDALYPKLVGLFNENYSPEWMYTDVGSYKLIYNRDALVGISSVDGSIITPWNDVDENSLTITRDDGIYYYSLNNNAWVHITTSSRNSLRALKVGNNLLLNSVEDNCYDKNGKVSTFSTATTLANFTIDAPRSGLINVYNIVRASYMGENLKEWDLGNNWMSPWLEAIKKTETYYLSLVGRGDRPIWNATTLLNYKNVTNVRNVDWQETSSPTYSTATINFGYYLSNGQFGTYGGPGNGNADVYTSRNGSVLNYYTSWDGGVIRYDSRLKDVEKSFTEPTYYSLSPNIDIMSFIDGFNTISLIRVGNSTLQLLVKESELQLVYNLLSSVSNISDYFVLQGQQFGIINNYINRIEMTGGNVTSQTPITSVEGLKFLGNTDRQAFFFSPMNRTISYFSADNTLEYLMDATEVDSDTATAFSKQTNDIFLLLKDRVVVFTNSGSMWEMLYPASHITFGSNSWSDGNRTWSYYKTSEEQKKVPIEIETLWWGDTTTRKMMNVDCVYVELWDDNYSNGTFEISFDGLVNNVATTKKQVFNVREKDWDRVTKTTYLRYQPAFQNCSSFRLNIKSDLAIKRLAVGYSSEGIPTISKNNI